MFWYYNTKLITNQLTHIHISDDRAPRDRDDIRGPPPRDDFRGPPPRDDFRGPPRDRDEYRGPPPRDNRGPPPAPIVRARSRSRDRGDR